MGDITKGAAGVVSAFGNIFTGLTEQGAANAQKRIARQNADVAERNADLTMAAAEGQEERLGMRSRAVAGAIKAHQGASGVRIDSGSSRDVRDSQRALGLFDAMTLKSNAARDAFGFKVKAKEFRDQAAVAKAKSNNAMIGASINALSSLLGGASSASSAYSQWQQAAGGTEALAEGMEGMSMAGSDAAAVLAF